jgi:hypothetical protein
MGFKQLDLARLAQKGKAVTSLAEVATAGLALRLGDSFQSSRVGLALENPRIFSTSAKRR